MFLIYVRVFWWLSEYILSKKNVIPLFEKEVRLMSQSSKMSVRRVNLGVLSLLLTYVRVLGWSSLIAVVWTKRVHAGLWGASMTVSPSRDR